MDQQYSQALDRPLAISSVGDCPSPSTLAQDPIVHSLEIYNARFTVLARQVLTAGSLCNEQLDDYIHQLSALQEILPDCMRFNKSWLDKSTVIPPWPIDVQAACVYSQKHHLLIWLHRKRADADHVESRDSAIDLFVSSVSASSANPLYGHEQSLESCRSILRVLVFFQTRERAAMICWTVSQQAFNAAWVLLSSMLETRNTLDAGILQQTYIVFVEMQSLGIHTLASGAVEKLGDHMEKFSAGDMTGEFMGSNRGMVLLEDPGSQSFRPGVAALMTPYATDGLTSRTGEVKEEAAMETGQRDGTAFVGTSKKQKTTAGKSCAKSKAPEKRPTVKQRRTSVPQRKYSGLWMKEEQSPKLSLSNIQSPSPPLGSANPDVQIVRPGSAGITVKNSSTASAAGLSNMFGNASTFQPCPPSAVQYGLQYEQLGATWTPFQMYTAAPNSTTPHERAIQMQRNYSNSYSEHSSDKHGNSQSSTQLSSPVQPHSFHGSPPSPQPRLLPHDLYEHGYFSLSSEQAHAGTPALAPGVNPSYQISEAPNLTWQLSPAGFRGDHQHLAPNSSL